MSVFRTRAHAVTTRDAIREHLARKEGVAPTTLQIGDYIARVRLEPGEGFAYEDLGQLDGHMTLWGDPVKLVEAVADITPADDD
jgi:hypothetical protein